MKSQEIQDVYNRISEMVEKLKDNVAYPCLKYEGVQYRMAEGTGIEVPEHLTCILQQYADNDKHGRQGFFPDIMCPTCRFTFLAVQAEKDMRETIRVEQLREAKVAADNVWARSHPEAAHGRTP